MEIQQVKNAYASQLTALQAQRQALRQHPQAQSGQNLDRLELTRELKQLEGEYEALRKGKEGFLSAQSLLRDAQAAQEQGQAATQELEEIGKILEVYRRIAAGGTVPPQDERKLMEYSHELYMAAKNMAWMKAQEGEDYDSLWDEEQEDPSAFPLSPADAAPPSPPEQPLPEES